MTDAPTLNRRRGKPALTNRWKFDAEVGSDDSRDAAAPGFLANLYCSWNVLRDDPAVEGGGDAGCAGCCRLSGIIVVLGPLVSVFVVIVDVEMECGWWMVDYGRLWIMVMVSTVRLSGLDALSRPGKNRICRRVDFGHGYITNIVSATKWGRWVVGQWNNIG